MANDEFRRGHEFRIKTLSHAGAFCHFGRDGALRCPRTPQRGIPTLVFVLSRVMKQILLCVTAMVSKVSLCERSKPRGVQFSRSRKIPFAQYPLDPDIDRERAQPLASKEHHTISNLRAYARQLA